MNGIIVINKPKGCTSHDIVKNVKKIFNTKVGHTGTLDPMATGVLPILIGKATLCSKYLINHDKTYKVKLKLGKKTDTADAEGKIIEEKKVNKKNLSKKNIEEIFETFIGKQNQIPPMYSAIKVNGKKLYEYARKGIDIEIKPRKIEIYNIELLNINNIKEEISFIVSCSKGTYIRTLCEDIAVKLETVGYMTELERQKVGEFCLDQAITLKDLEEKDIKNIEEKVITIEDLFKKSESIELEKEYFNLFLNGGRIVQKGKKNGAYRIYINNEFIGIGTINKERLKRDIII